MRLKRFLIAASLTVSGCVGTGPSPEVIASVNAERQQANALAEAHKITWVEAAKRSNEAIIRTAGPSVDDDARLLMAYRLALASQVDAGQITHEVAEYRFAEKKAELSDRDNARRAAALSALGDSMQRTAQTIQPPPPVYLPPVQTSFQNSTTRLQTNCTSQAFGSIVTTNCN